MAGDGACRAQERRGPRHALHKLGGGRRGVRNQSGTEKAPPFSTCYESCGEYYYRYTVSKIEGRLFGFVIQANFDFSVQN